MIEDLADYEGAYSEEQGGHYFISKDGTDVLRVPRLQAFKDRVLRCDFEVLVSDLGEEDVAELVFLVLLHRFCRDSFRKKADKVAFRDLRTGKTWQLAYVF